MGQGPSCLRCGGPTFTHWWHGYVCPYCRQYDATQRVAKQAARQQQPQQIYYQEPEYERPVAPSNPDKFGVADFVAISITLFIMFSALSFVWTNIVYPVLHFLSFGLL